MKRPLRIEFAGAILAAILFVLMVGLVEILGPDRFDLVHLSAENPPEPVVQTPAISSPLVPDCQQTENAFAAKLEQSKSCVVDADCSLARFECPFECVSSVATTILDELKRDEGEFLNACSRCESSCPQTLTKWRAACVRQRCIVLDRSIDELQEETLRHLDETG